MESLKKVVEFLMKLLVKLPINCIKYIKDLIKTCLESIVSIFKNKEKITEIKENDTVRENNIEEEKYNNQSVEEIKGIEENEIIEDNNQQDGEIGEYILGGEPKNDSEQKDKIETKENVEIIKKKEEEEKQKEQIIENTQVIVEPAPVVITNSLKAMDSTQSVEPSKFIEPEPILPKILFEDIDKNEEVFSRIFQELEKVKNSLSLPEMDQKIFMKRIENLEKELKKYKTKLEKEIKEEDIEEDEYSESVSNVFIEILSKNYKIVIENILKNIEYKRDKCYKDAFQIFESFLLNLDFRKGDYQIKNIKNIRNNDTDYFKVIDIRTEKETEDGNVKEITWQPYILNYKDKDGEEKEVYILGQLIFYRYGRLN